MANMDDKTAGRAQAVVTGELADGALNARAGTLEFTIGGRDGVDLETNPYELLSASLAACTAMTIRLAAARRKYPVSHFEVSVSYHHGADDGRDAFERAITLQGELNEEQRVQLMQDVEMSPVGRALGRGADIRTRDNVSSGHPSNLPANYKDDLQELSIPNIDPD